MRVWLVQRLFCLVALAKVVLVYGDWLRENASDFG